MQAYTDMLLYVNCYSHINISPPSSFLDYFTELHGQSERSLQEVLSPLGSLYSQNSPLFAELYSDLRQYYRGVALNLDENLSDFWSQLLERTFKASASTDVSKKIQRGEEIKSFKSETFAGVWIDDSHIG